MKWIRQALARGYCTKRNQSKVLDPNLVEDMAVEIEKALGSLIADKAETQSYSEDRLKHAIKLLEQREAMIASRRRDKEFNKIFEEFKQACIMATDDHDYLAYPCGVANCPIHKDES